MKNKLYYRFAASIFLLAFIILGYLVKFYPASLTNFDSSLQTSIFNMRSPELTSILSRVTKIGNSKSIIALVIILLIAFYLKKWYAEALYLGGLVVLVPGILGPLAKHFYHRARPDLAVRLIKEHGYSFPSGHSTTSMIVFLALIFILVPRVKSKLGKTVLTIFLLALILVIGFSRVYLGVHYPTDVLGGYSLAAAAVLFAYPIYDKYRFNLRFKGVQK